jgi:mono/diheme cytochrome c family protein
MKAKLIASIVPFVIATATGAAAAAGGSTAAATSAERTVLERGRYLVGIGGCNDCHTAGFAQSAGDVPEGDRLTGNPVGFQGPWGTTYPANLRLVVQTLTETQWLVTARTAMRPPMPWFNLRDAKDDDLRAMYRYIRSLGPKGDPAPAYAAPGQPVNTPYIVFVPQNLPQTHAAR